MSWNKTPFFFFFSGFRQVSYPSMEKVAITVLPQAVPKRTSVLRKGPLFQSLSFPFWRKQEMQSSGKQARKNADRHQGREQEPEEIILSSLFFTHRKALSSHPSLGLHLTIEHLMAMLWHLSPASRMQNHGHGLSQNKKSQGWVHRILEIPATPSIAYDSTKSEVILASRRHRP